MNDGFGPDFAVTGMTWSAFRPSDDCCQYSYLIPSNMFAVVVLGYVQEIFADLNLADSESIIADAKRLQAEIQEGIENYAYTTNSKGEKIYAFEVDGLGNASIMDDPNVPSLLAAPYLGYCVMSMTKCIKQLVGPFSALKIHTSMKGSTQVVSEVLIPSIAISGRLPYQFKA